MKRPSPLVREGVRASVVALHAGEHSTILSALCARFPHIQPAQWEDRFARAQVFDGDGQPIALAAPLVGATVVQYFRERTDERPVPFEAQILFRNDDLLVVDKPPFLPVAPVGAFVQETLLTRLISQTGIDTLSPLHRLDKDTMGVMLFSVRPQTRGAYQALFREGQIHKIYEALAPADTGDRSFPLTLHNRIEDDPQHFMRVRVAQAGAPNASTHIERMNVVGTLATYRLTPHTGKRHQLRAHMASLGAPIVNDAIYGRFAAKDAPPDFTAPLQLIARTLEFDDPVHKLSMCFKSSWTLVKMDI